jgi:hypothetical protein
VSDDALFGTHIREAMRVLGGQSGGQSAPSNEQLNAKPPLSANDMANMEKIAQLRGHLGKLRAQIVMARDILLRYEHRTPKPDYPVQALTILSTALDLEAP